MAIDLNIDKGNAFQTVALILPYVHLLTDRSDEIAENRIDRCDRTFLFSIVNGLNVTTNVSKTIEEQEGNSHFDFVFGQRLIFFRHDFDDIEQNHASTTDDVFVETIRCAHGDVRLHQTSLESQCDRLHARDMFPFIHRQSKTHVRSNRPRRNERTWRWESFPI